MLRALVAAMVLCLASGSPRAESGIASVYWHGQRTANGEHLCTSCLTAAHKSLPFGTIAQVCIVARCIQVRINDRGPFVRGRIIDLTPAAEHALGFDGLASVTVTPISLGQQVHAHHHRHHRARIVRR